MKDRMYAIAAKNLAGTRAELTFEEGYPPMAPTAGNERLLGLMNEAAREAGLAEVGELDPMMRGAGMFRLLRRLWIRCRGYGGDWDGGACAGRVGGCGEFAEAGEEGGVVDPEVAVRRWQTFYGKK